MSYRTFTEVGKLLEAGALDLTGPETGALLCIAWFANESENLEAWPGVETMTEWTGQTTSTLYRALRGLREKKCIDLMGKKNRFRARLLDLQSFIVNDPVGHSERPSRPNRPTQSVTMTDELSSTSGVTQVGNFAPCGGNQAEGDVVPSLKDLRPENPTPTKVAKFLVEYVPREMVKYGYQPRGTLPGGRGAVVNQIKRLMDVNQNTGEVRGMSLEEILDAMETYALSTHLWNPNKHFAWDFFDGNTQARLGNMMGSSSVTDSDRGDDSVWTSPLNEGL